MLPHRVSNSAVQTHCPTNVKHFVFWSVTYWTLACLALRCPEVMAKQTAYVYTLLHILARSNTHAEVSVPDLDGAVLTTGCYQLPVTAVGATCGHHLLPLEGARLEHGFVLLLWLHVPCAYSAVNRQKRSATGDFSGILKPLHITQAGQLNRKQIISIQFSLHVTQISIMEEEFI